MQAAALRIKCCEAGVIGKAQGENGVGWVSEVGFAPIGDDTKVAKGGTGRKKCLPSAVV
jgi:hypothetical protein